MEISTKHNDNLNMIMLLWDDSMTAIKYKWYGNSIILMWQWNTNTVQKYTFWHDNGVLLSYQIQIRFDYKLLLMKFFQVKLLRELNDLCKMFLFKERFDRTEGTLVKFHNILRYYTEIGENVWCVKLKKYRKKYKMYI